MALHPKFPTSPYAPLISEQRWFPADEALRSTAYEKVLPPLVAKVRQEVSNILPEQTLGRGLRRTYFGNDVVRETVSVMGTPAFMEFVESIQSESVTFEHVPMGGGANRQDSLIVEVDTENEDKDLEALDIPLPKLT